MVALVTFGLRTTPYQKPNELLSVVKEKRNSNPGLWKELSKYREALEPSSPCSSQHSDTFGAYCENRQGMWPNDCPVNDMDMMRDFMAFVVTRLQVRRGVLAFPLGLWWVCEHRGAPWCAGSWLSWQRSNVIPVPLYPAAHFAPHPRTPSPPALLGRLCEIYVTTILLLWKASTKCY